MMPPAAEPPRVLVAGLGNVFLGDDAFGVDVVKRLSALALPGHVRVLDAGIRTVHLAYELRERVYDTVILIDVACRGNAPGTLYVLEPETRDAMGSAWAADGHRIAPHNVFALVRQLGGDLPRVLIVACEPSAFDAESGLSPAVAAAVDGAVELVWRLIGSAAGVPVQT